MKVIAILLAGVLMLVSCAKNSISGGGNTLTETRTVDSFSSVQLEGSGRVNIIQGIEQKVQITGYENLLPLYQTFIQNGTLVLKFKNDYYNIRNNNITINIIMPALVRIAVNGSGEYTIKNFGGDDFRGEINGSGNIYSDNCVYNNAALRVNGSGYIGAANINAKEANVEVNGSGKIEVTCAEKLKAIIHGSGEINYWGNPEVVAEVSGSGSVRKK